MRIKLPKEKRLEKTDVADMPKSDGSPQAMLQGRSMLDRMVAILLGEAILLTGKAKTVV